MVRFFNPSTKANLSSTVSLLLCNFWWCSLHSGTCFLLMPAICIVKKSIFFVLYLCLRSWTFRTWCISAGKVPHITHALCMFETVSLRFHFFAIVSSIIGVLVKNFPSRLNELGIANPLFVYGHFRSRPNFWKAFALFRSLYFKSSIRAHKCLRWYLIIAPIRVLLSTNE